MTKLSQWMKEHGRNDEWLAEALRCHRSQASRIRRGLNAPSPVRALEIERLTRGKVKATDLMRAVVAHASTPSEGAAA